MGVNTYHYSFYGVKIPYNEALSELFDEVGEIAEEASEMILFDGMGGRYTIIGAKLFEMDEYGEGSEFTTIALDSLPQIETEYRAKFAKYFPEFKHLIDGKKFELMVFAHYS